MTTGQGPSVNDARGPPPALNGTTLHQELKKLMGAIDLKTSVIKITELLSARFGGADLTSWDREIKAFITEILNDTLHGISNNALSAFTWDGKRIRLQPGSLGKRGTITHPSGEVYEGDLVKGMAHGRGISLFASGNVYEGEFKDDNRHGWGTFTWADGSVYVGQWVDGEEHGKGTLKYDNGSVFEGEFRKGSNYGKGPDEVDSKAVIAYGLVNKAHTAWVLHF